MPDRTCDKIYRSWHDSGTLFYRTGNTVTGQQSLGSIFPVTHGKCFSAWKDRGTDTADSSGSRHVHKRAFFLSLFLPDGSGIFIASGTAFFSLHRDRTSCLRGCSGCTRNCPSAVELPQDGVPVTSGDCFMCQKCIGVCPKENIHSGIRIIRGNEWWMTLIRVALLLLLCQYL